MSQPNFWNMFEDLIWFFIICVLSIILSSIIGSPKLGPFGTLIHWCTIVGVLIHELCHFFACLLLNVPVSDFSVKSIGKGAAGYVQLDEFADISFMQATVIALAPLIISTWLFFFCLEVAFSETVSLFAKIFSGFVAFSLLFGACPSIPDLKFISRHFNLDRRYSFYQIFLVIVASITVWSLDLIYNWQLFDFIYYFFIGGAYYALKYSLRAVNSVYSSLRYNERKKMSRISKFNDYSKKRCKLVKPSKMEEAQW